MRILLISDTHGESKKMDMILKNETFDIACHLGDSEFDETQLKGRFHYYVSGNNDYFSKGESFFSVGAKKVGLLHGHTIGVSRSNYQKSLTDWGQKNHLDIVIFGHLHIPIAQEISNILIVNPGSISFPRSNQGSTYAIITIKGDKSEVDFIRI